MRKGRYYLTAASQPTYRIVHDDDGEPHEVRNGECHFVEATHDDGHIFQADAGSEAEANELIAALPSDFDAEDDRRFGFIRTMYGSPAWGTEEEIGLMDDAERHFAGVC
jgi:hypothetical protein